jgi:hypothetical protein
MSTALTTRGEAAVIKSDEEFTADFAALHDEEVKHQGRLDKCIFAMGDLLWQWNPDQATLRSLSRAYGYGVKTLETRRDTAHEIPPAVRNPDLSYTAHLEAVKIGDVDERTALIESSSGMTANEVREAVHAKRLELGEIKPAKVTALVPNGYNALDLSGLNWSGGFDITDGTSLLKVRGTIVNGECQLTLDTSSPVEDEPEVASAARGTKQIVSFALAAAE